MVKISFCKKLSTLPRNKALNKTPTQCKQELNVNESNLQGKLVEKMSWSNFATANTVAN